jgi:hypothetical protein
MSFSISLLVPLLLAAEPDRHEELIRAAVAKSVPLLEKGAAGHSERRTCFACHNQAVPLFALVAARNRGFTVDDDALARQAKAVAGFLETNKDNYLKGRGTGGQVDTAGYALLTLEHAGHKPDDTTAAVVDYLLQKDMKKDHWTATSNRPPSEASSFTTTYLALRGLQVFGAKERVDERIGQVRTWLENATAKDTEDRVFRLWAMKRAGSSQDLVEKAAQELLAAECEGGGWAQKEEMEPDAYATGTALVVLHEAAALPPGDPVFERGIAFLLRTQHDDGSWHVRSRSKPFQAYYESGFPHGKDQFISIAASAWATNALLLPLPVGQAACWPIP